MSEFNGPWNVTSMYYHAHGQDRSYFLVDKDGKALHSPGGDCGTMRSPEPYAGYGFSKAYADLAAAAPQLYEALEIVCLKFSCLDDAAWSVVHDAMDAANGHADRKAASGEQG